MATTFYFPSDRRADPSLAPVPAPGWSGTNTISRWMMRTEKGSSPMVNWPMFAYTGTAARNAMLDRQYISAPLKGQQVISGYASGRLQVAESATNDNVDAIVTTLRVFSKDGTILRGTCYPLANRGGPANEFSTTATYTTRGMITGARVTTGSLMTGVTGLDGDRLVFEIGYMNTTVGVSVGAGARWGDSAPILSGVGEAQTTAGAGWLTMDVDLVFYRPNAASITS